MIVQFLTVVLLPQLEFLSGASCNSLIALLEWICTLVPGKRVSARLGPKSQSAWPQHTSLLSSVTIASLLLFTVNKHSIWIGQSPRIILESWTLFWHFGGPCWVEKDYAWIIFCSRKWGWWKTQAWRHFIITEADTLDIISASWFFRKTTMLSQSTQQKNKKEYLDILKNPLVFVVLVFWKDPFVFEASFLFCCEQ